MAVTFADAVPLTVVVDAGMLSIGEGVGCAACPLSPAYADCNTLGLTVLGICGACGPSRDQLNGVSDAAIVAEVDLPPA
jgi:hypothetical protein